VKALPKPTVTALQRHKGIPPFVLGPSSTISSDVVREIAKLGHPVHRVSGEDPVANAIALARYDEGSFGWNVNDPGHGFIVAARTRRWTPPQLRLSPPRAPGARCCSPTAPIRFRRRCAATCSTSSRATPRTRRAPSTTTCG
jgi:hypothetical protein